MPYQIKEIFYTLQGEGFHSGRPAVFCRFSGCNLWSGRESDRFSANCQFCDTDFNGTDGSFGGKYDDADGLAKVINSLWPSGQSGRRYVVLTGGEPGLQVDAELIQSLHQSAFTIGIETNGTVELPDQIDWICVSPKGMNELRIRSGNELKLVYPQDCLDPRSFTQLEFDHFFLQAMDGPDAESHLKETIDYCLQHPTWRLSLQAHKILGIP